MNKHTPGPWTQGYGNYVYQGDRYGPQDGNRLIAICEPSTRTQQDWDQVFANARLIAAAPALLAALEVISAARASQDKEFDVDAWYLQVRAAIAQAKGEEV